MRVCFTLARAQLRRPPPPPLPSRPFAMSSPAHNPPSSPSRGDERDDLAEEHANAPTPSEHNVEPFSDRAPSEEEDEGEDLVGDDMMKCVRPTRSEAPGRGGKGRLGGLRECRAEAALRGQLGASVQGTSWDFAALAPPRAVWAPCARDSAIDVPLGRTWFHGRAGGGWFRA